MKRKYLRVFLDATTSSRSLARAPVHNGTSSGREPTRCTLMPSAQRLWQSYKTATGYDAAHSRSVLRHALRVWSYWHEVYGAPKVHKQFCASASTLARRALRGWRRWTIRTRLFVPSWQRCRVQPRWLPPCPPANLWPDDGLRSHRSLTSRMAASSGKESRGHSRNSNWKHTGTIPKRNNDSGAAKSGRLPISLSSRSPTSLLPVGCGSGHGRAAQPRRSSGKPGTVGGKKSSFGTVSGKSSVRQDILAMATFHTHQERRSIDFDAADLLPRLALLSATTNSCTAGMK